MKRSALKKTAYGLLALAVLLAALGVYRTGHKTVVLGYHSVSEEPFTDAESLFVRPSELEEQIKALQDAGWEFIFAHEADGKSLKKRVCLTFDDGYMDNLTVLLPILEKYSAKATIFVVPKLLDFNERYLTTAQLQELAASPLIEIGSHSMSHTDFGKLSPEDVRKELEDSKEALSELTNKEILSFAYPGGHYSAEDAKAAAETYEKCFTFSGARQYLSFYCRDNLLPRISVYRGWSPEYLMGQIRTARPGRNVPAAY